MKKTQNDLFLGIDVQVNRGCPYYIINSNLEYIDSGWLQGHGKDDICHQLNDLRGQLQTKPGIKIAVGIDAPRMGLIKPRQFYWRHGRWEMRTANEKGYGRHCEVVIKALGIANPQWTPLVQKTPPWMDLGYSLFQTLHEFEYLYEVFPSASYAMLHDEQRPQVALSFANFFHDPKDMLDACVSAYTVHAFIHRQGYEVGGGDGLGTIVLPGRLPVSASHPLLHWPAE